MVASSSILLICNPNGLISGMFSASENALKLCAELCVIYAVWLGILQILSDCKVNDRFARILNPVIRKLFGNVDKETAKLISLNLSSNMLGMGGASTPLGIKAMQRLDDHSGTATKAMIMLMVINATSVQLLPTTVLGLRSSMGSSNPSDIILPSLIATMITTIVGISLVVLCSRKKKRHL